MPADHRSNRRGRFVPCIVAQLAQRIRRGPRQIHREDLYAVHFLGILKQTAGLHGRLLLLKVVQLLLHGFQFCGKRSRAGGQVVDIAYLQRARRLVEHIGFFIQQAQHAVACCAFDAPDTRRHAGFGQNLEAAQFGRI